MSFNLFQDSAGLQTTLRDSTVSGYLAGTITTNNFTAILGEHCNTNSGGYASILMGCCNVICSGTVYGSIAGGMNNTISGNYSFIGSGSNNGILSPGSFIGGGSDNSIGLPSGGSTISGGIGNVVAGFSS